MPIVHEGATGPKFSHGARTIELALPSVSDADSLTQKQLLADGDELLDRWPATTTRCARPAERSDHLHVSDVLTDEAQDLAVSDLMAMTDPHLNTPPAGQRDRRGPVEQFRAPRPQAAARFGEHGVQCLVTNS